MTAPGENLEFYPSTHYKKKVSGAPVIEAAVEAAIGNGAYSAVAVAGPVREMLVLAGAATVVVFFARRGNSIGLIGIFQADEDSLIKRKRAELKKLFGKEGRP
jgi:hypothetical protein